MTSTCRYSSAAKQRESTLRSSLAYPQPGTDSEGVGGGAAVQLGGGDPYRPSPHFLISSESISMLAQSFCFLFPPTLFLGPAGISCVGLSHPPRVCPVLLSGCLQGRPDTRDSPCRDPGVPGNRLVPSRWPTTANSHLVPPTQRKTCSFRVSPFP